MHLGEPLFGSGSQGWPSIAGPIGFTQPPMPVSRPFLSPTPTLAMPNPLMTGLVGAAAPTGPAAAEAYGGTMPGFGTGWLASVPNPLTGQPWTGAEISIGITAPMLLAAVAMRRGQLLGPTSDQEIEDFVSDALDLLPGSNDVEVRCESGKATLSGTVPNKRLKRDVGEIAWAIPSVNDVQNNVTVTARRRSRAGREGEPAAAAGRKQG
jgi:hypothetical protein